MKAFVCMGLVLCLLAGFCGCGQEVAKETTIAVTTTAIPTTEATPTELLEHTITQRIHESLPEFTFELRWYVRRDDRWPDIKYPDIRAVEISSPNGEFHQLFDEFEVDKEISLYNMDVVGLSLADYNNDGYLDLRLQLVVHRNMSCSLFWLWDITSQRFIENEQLRELSYGCSLFIDDDDNLRGAYTAGAGVGWGHTIYHYENGEFSATEARDWLVESGRVYVSTYRLIDGKIQLISKEPEEYH